MDTTQLTQRLLELEAEENMREQDRKFHALKEELDEDGLELLVDEEHCFSVRAK